MLALLVAACPAPPVENGGGGGDGAGGEDGAGSPDRVLPSSALDPLAAPLIARARDRVSGGEVRAIVVRADVAIAADDSLSWIRVGLVLGPFGLRWFERAPRGIEDAAGYGLEPGADARAGAIARAVESEAAWLSAEDCQVLSAAVCQGMLSEELVRAEEAIAGDVRRVAIGSVGALVTTREGDRLLEGEDGEPVPIE